MPGTTPTVDTVMLRAEMPNPSGGIALICRTALSTDL